jgi:hypothetical protein
MLYIYDMVEGRQDPAPESLPSVRENTTETGRVQWPAPRLQIRQPESRVILPPCGLPH